MRQRASTALGRGEVLKITLPALSNLIFVNIIYTVVLLATFS